MKLRSKIYNFVYKTTNIINNKIYIGVHCTNNLNDGYKGSGLLLNRAILKYGIENFQLEILKLFDTIKDAYNYEKEIVTEEFIKQDNVYNIAIGGSGGNLGVIVNKKISENKKEYHKYLSEEKKTQRNLKCSINNPRIYKGTLPWNNNVNRNNPKNLQLWRDANIIQKIWLENNKPGYVVLNRLYDSKSFYKSGNTNYQIINNMIKRFKLDWIPENDKYWLEFYHST